MPRPIIVYSATVGFEEKVVAAPSKKAAAEAMGMSIHEFNTYAGETGNEGHIALAMLEPGTAFKRSNNRFFRLREQKVADGWWRVHDHLGEPWRKGVEPDIVLP